MEILTFINHQKKGLKITIYFKENNALPIKHKSAANINLITEFSSGQTFHALQIDRVITPKPLMAIHFPLSDIIPT